MMTNKEHRYTVKGHWPFPTDMLRHDGSRPASPEDQGAIDRLSTEHATDKAAFDDAEINLVGPYKPNTARWESFGWAVPSDTDHAFFKRIREEDERRADLAKVALTKLTHEEADALRYIFAKMAA